MPHEKKRLTFWQHHGLAFLLTVPLLTVIRLIGMMAEVGGAPNLFLHSAILVALAYPLETAGAYAGMKYLDRRLPLMLRAIVGCVALAPIIAFLSPVVSWTVGVGPEAIVLSTTRAELLAVISQRYPFILMGYVFVGTTLWMMINFSWWRQEFEAPIATAVPTVDAAGTAHQPSSPISATPLFMDRVAVEKRGTLWGLSSELHYVRVYTSNGEDLVLMRLADAIGQCADVEGLQIHRSHWVARAGVARIENSDGRVAIILRNGTELPVSRSQQSAAKHFFSDLI